MKQTPLTYLQNQLNKQLLADGSTTNFISDWKGLSDTDKDQLKAWAEEEQKAIG